MKNVTNKEFILYKVTSPSGKIYIGITCETLEDRKSKHKYTANRMQKSHKFSNAIKYYGIDGMNWEVVFNNLSQEKAIELEKQLIEEHDTYKNGYNSTKGGEGAWGYKWNEEALKKSRKHLEETYYSDPEWKKKKSEITKNWYKNNPKEGKKLREKSYKRLKENKHKWEDKRIGGNRKPENLAKMVKSKGCEEFNAYCIETRQYVGTWLHKTQCAKDLGIMSAKISTCLNGGRKQTGGYIFRLVSDSEVNREEVKDKWFDELKRRPNRKKK